MVPVPADAAPAMRTCRFGPLEITYDERVLEPRAWTFLQSRWAADLAVEAPPGPLLELCAGAGHIGLAAAVLSDRALVQVEADPVAAGHARANAERAHWTARSEVRVAPLDSALHVGERFPLVIADPPYLRSDEIDRFPADPRLAIDGGDDGLAVVRGCLAVGALHLVAGGALLLQVAGPRQAARVVGLAAEQHPELSCCETRAVDDERAVVLLRRAGP